jgi:hypothetical protein
MLGKPTLRAVVKDIADNPINALLSGAAAHEPNKKSAGQLQAERQKLSIARSVAKEQTGKLRDRIAALESEKRAIIQRLNRFARSARARTVIEPTTSARGDTCRVVGEERQQELRQEVDAFYDARRVTATAGLDAEELRLRGELDRHRDTVATQTGRGRSIAGQLRRARASEAKAESDSEVEAEIDPSLLYVWRKVKKHITAGPKMSRAEAFLHWVEENPEEVTAMLTERVKGLESELDVAQYGEEARAVAERAAREEYEQVPGLEDVPFN